MKVIRFPGSVESEQAGRAAGEEIDAMLAGEVSGDHAVAMRELREDVRALAPELDAEFEGRLQAWLAESLEWERAPRRPWRSRVAAARRRLRGKPGRLVALGGAGSIVAAVIVVLVLAGGGAHENAAVSISAAGESRPEGAVASSPAATAKHSDAAAAPALSEPTQTFERGGARLQQLGASVTLAPHGAEGVQEAADAVTRLAASDGGYVESSHLQVRRSGGPSEAQLLLSIPSAKLSAAIAALGRIAPLRSVSQESQDITNTYETAKRRLGDDEAVRRALLRALAAATSEGQIDSLRAQISANREALARDRSRLHSISHTAATSQLEVAITGSGAASGSRSTLDRGLHDAGHVLAVAGAVALVALAVIFPLALLAFALDALRRAWQRRRREAALGP